VLPGWLQCAAWPTLLFLRPRCVMPEPILDAAWWDQRYRDRSDGWELGEPAPPLRLFLERDARAPQPPGRVLVPGCGRGHEAALLAGLGFAVVGLDLSSLALGEARRCHGDGNPALQWLQADLFDSQALQAAGLGAASCDGVLEHTCFCAIDPGLRAAYIALMAQLLRPGGWLLGLFWCHDRPGGPPFGSDPAQLADQFIQAGFRSELWQPADQSAIGRDGQRRAQEWLGLWRRPA
jgi:methyl halide transferase